jgi:hypothetical protein
MKICMQHGYLGLSSTMIFVVRSTVLSTVKNGTLKFRTE